MEMRYCCTYQVYHVEYHADIGQHGRHTEHPVNRIFDEKDVILSGLLPPLPFQLSFTLEHLDQNTLPLLGVRCGYCSSTGRRDDRCGQQCLQGSVRSGRCGCVSCAFLGSGSLVTYSTGKADDEDQGGDKSKGVSPAKVLIGDFQYGTVYQCT